MAYVPSLSELDAHQGDARLAIGGGGSMAGNLPLAELFSPETIGKLEQATNTYVANKNKEYDAFVNKVAEAKKNASRIEGVYSGDLPLINQKKRELFSLIDKKPYLMTPDAPIKYAKEYQELLDLENNYLQKVDLSKSHNILDKEYRKTFTDPKYNNELNRARYEKWKQQPIDERGSFYPIANPSSDITKLTKNLSEYKILGAPTSKEIGGVEGYTAIDQPYTIDQNKLLGDLVEHGDYYGAVYDELLTPEQQKIEGDRQSYINKKLMQGIPISGQEKTQIRSNVPFNQDFRRETQQATFDNQKAIQNAKDLQDAKDKVQKRREDDLKELNNPKYALVRQIINDVNVFDNYKNGTKVALAKSGLNGQVYDITKLVSQTPSTKEWADGDKVYTDGVNIVKMNKKGNAETFNKEQVGVSIADDKKVGKDYYEFNYIKNNITPETKEATQGEKKVFSAEKQLENPKVNQTLKQNYIELKSKYPIIDTNGIMGDSAHQSRVSDHNTMDAIDIVNFGDKSNEIISDIQSQKGVSYIIFNKQIWKPNIGWKPYSGENSHKDHIHVSYTRDAKQQPKTTAQKWTGKFDSKGNMIYK